MNSFILKLLLLSLLFEMNRFLMAFFFFEYMIFFSWNEFFQIIIIIIFIIIMSFPCRLRQDVRPGL